MADQEHEPKEPALPTKEELLALPHWARVAFAARCARRVQPLFKHCWPDATQEHIEALESAITFSERTAADATAINDTVVAFALSVSTSTFLAAASAAFADAAVHSDAAAHVVYAAARAAAFPASTTSDYDSAAESARTAVVTRFGVDDDVNTAMRRDYELLLVAARVEKWTDDTPVPPEFFGPLWPEGAPKVWPINHQDRGDNYGQRILLELEVPDGVADDEIAELVEDLLLKANALHEAHGGAGLNLEQLQVWETSDMPQEVES